MRRFMGVFWQGFVMIFTRGIRVERQIKLIIPAEFKTGFGQGIITRLCTRMTFGKVGSMSGNFLGDDTVFDILFIRQT